MAIGSRLTGAMAVRQVIRGLSPTAAPGEQLRGHEPALTLAGFAVPLFARKADGFQSVGETCRRPAT